ncbi:MAG: aminotransferase class V-fold PLP-dependent enzyme [Thermoplasmatales archaeon]|nr:MAG: aminotransferase class V-fold PLP-dependent enzyme [Thermoplasmatales archaeon]
MDVKRIRQDFPILNRKIDGQPIIYFDNACMTLKPRQVIDAMNDYYCNFSACAGRSIHKLGTIVTIRYDEAREKIRKFINAKESREIIFSKNTTEGINLLARTLQLKKGDIVLTTDREHNSNLLPWHIQKELRGINHKVVESKEDNTFDLGRFENLMSNKVKLVSMVHASNLDGYTIPADEIIKTAHDYGALVLLDGAQSASRVSIDVQKLDVDFFAFSIHKMLGPTGIGVLYGKYHLLKDLEPFMVGGDTVEKSTYTSHNLLDVPEKFEAGLQNYAGAIGAGAAADYIMKIGKDKIGEYIFKLNSYISSEIKDIPGIVIIGPADPVLRGGIISFNIENYEPHDIAMFLDDANIMVRSGVFCVHSWFNARNIKGAVRVSLYVYNTIDECRILIEKIKEFIS